MKTEPQETVPETVTTPSTNEVAVIALSVITEPYIMKIFLFGVILALVAWYISRCRPDTEVLET